MPSEPDYSASLTLISKCTVLPDRNSTIGHLKLSVSDLPMLSCHYIQKGCLFTRPTLPDDSLINFLKRGLSQTLSHFPPLAGRLITDSDGHVYLTSNDAGVDLIYVDASNLFVHDLLGPTHVPDCFKEFFAFDRTVSYCGHFIPILAVQVTELNDGVFIGCTVNHAVIDGTSLWNFFNTFAELCRGVKKISNQPEFSRDSILISPVVLKLPEGGPKITFNSDAPLKERIFSFNRESIQKLKARTNNQKWKESDEDEVINAFEILGNHKNDSLLNWFKNTVSIDDDKVTETKTAVELSSFQSLCALLWRAVTRARKLPPSKTTTFRIAVNCRHRLEPKLDPYYFGNAIQSIPTYATASDVLNRDTRWCAEQLNKNVKAHDNNMVRRFVEDWESNPRCFPLGNADGASITMGSSPRFPMYENDFGWGRPLAVRSGKANKFDGKISAFPGRDESGSVDLEVVLAPETMDALEADWEFMQYVSR